MIDSYVVTNIIHMEDKLIIRVTFLDEKGNKVFRDSVELPKDRYVKNGEIDADKLEKDLDRLVESKIKEIEKRIARSTLRLIGKRRKLRKKREDKGEKQKYAEKEPDVGDEK